MGFSLIQTIKWPLQNSARNLRPVERDLISHSVQAHLLSELQLLCPLAIVCLGKVAAYACGLCFSGSQFKFASSTRLEAIRGKRFDVAVTPSLQAHLYSTELPVKRRMGNRQKIVDEIRQVIKDHWSVQLGHII
jgi:hypothetical protein